MIERRAVRRYALSLPITARVPALGSLSVGETHSISAQGISFTLEHPLELGVALEFTVTVSAELVGDADLFINCTGKVLRVNDREGHRFGVVASIEQHEVSRDNRAAHVRLSAMSKRVTHWNLSGTYFETCNCDLLCPCASLKLPTTGECTVLIGWHIEKGCFGDTPLDGLNVAVAMHTLGHMLEANWKAAIYLDDRAHLSQKEALEYIFSSRTDGHPLKFVRLIADVLGVRSVPIEYHAEGKRRRLRIPDIAEAEIERVPEFSEIRVTVANRPLCFAPGYRAEVAQSKVFSYSDYGFKWDITEKNGFFSPFQYASQ